MILAVVGSVDRGRLVLRVVLNALAIPHSSTIGLAVKPAVVLANVVHTHIGFAEPTHKAVTVVRLAQPLRLCRGLLLKRYRRIALGQALCRSG